jgi:hypothetical protein
LLQVVDLCLLDHSYILTDCPHDAVSLADRISYEPLDDRTTYVLLQGILSAIRVLFNNGITHGAITSSNILVADLSPKNPRFWLTGFLPTRPMSQDKIKESHSADVGRALRTIAEACGDSDYFEDPAANTIFAGFLQALQSKTLSIKEILDEFNTLTYGSVDTPFQRVYLSKVFLIEQVQFDDQVYYWKIELAQMARAFLAQNTEKSQAAYENILRTKSRKNLSDRAGKELLHSNEAEKLFCRLGMDFDVCAKLRPKRKRHCIYELPIRIQLTHHAPSGMWNLSQLINAIPPTELLDIGNLKDCVEVGGDTKSEGLYVDFSTFEHACRLLGVSLPESNPNPGANQFQLVNSGNGDLVLVEEKLLGTPIFRRSSRTMYYGSTEYSEASALQLCIERNFESLRRGILQSRHPPQSVEELYQRQQTQEFPESKFQSLTESQSENMLDFHFRPRVCSTQHQDQLERSTEDWVDEQTQRMRYQKVEGLFY